MTDQKNNAGKPGFRSNTTAFTDPAKIRRQAEQKAKTINIPDPESMTNEEIRQLLYEMQVKQLETEMHVEQLTGGLKKYWDQLELLTTITENMQDMVILTEPGGNITFAGKSLEILGYSPDLLVGKNVMDFVHPEDINRAIEAYNEFVAGNDPPRIQFRCRCKDGSYMWTETRGTVLTDENGNPDKIVLSSRDITERKRTEDALREQTELFQKISDNMFDLISIADIEGNYKYIGSSRNLLGYDPETLVGKNFMEFIHPEDADEITSVFDEALKRGEKVRKVEYRYKTAGGSYSWLETIGKIIMGESGSPEELIFSTRDITDRKQAEEALRETELRFRTVLENLPGGIFAHDLNGRIFMVNHQACKNTGYSREELLQMSVGEIDPHAASREDQTNLWHKLEPGQAATIESIHTRKDGTQYPVEIHLNGIILDGRPAILPVAFDISERKKAEKDLAEQHSLIKAIYRNAPLIMMVVDCDRRLRKVNGFATQFAGRSEQEMLGLRGGEALRCLHALDDPQGCGFGEVCRDCVIRNKVLETLEKGVPNLQIEAHFDFSSKDSTQTLTFLVSTTPITFQGENMSLVIIMDITERKQAQKEKEKLHSQLAQAQKMESVGRLAGGVAHDFNNKLSIINGYAELTLDMLEPADTVYENVREIYNAGKRSEDIVRQLLAFARRQTISPARVDLNYTISNMLKMLQRLIGENIDLAWRPGNNLWPVKIDPSQLDQIMANLAVNARDAISDVGMLTIETKNVVIGEDHCRLYSYFVPGRYVMLAVTDNGCGMEKQVQDNLFEPFFTTKGTGKGTGLGLSTIYGIVKQNKGFINVYSEPGLGTTFKIYLPLHEEQESVESRCITESGKQMPTGSETLLLVEDEPAILHMGRGMLEKLGYTVLIAEKPEEALELADKYDGRIHLLITDVVMPEMNGRDLAGKLSDRFPGLKTIYMSGYTADVIAHHGVLDAGVRFIQKPFSVNDLAVKVRDAIDQE